MANALWFLYNCYFFSLALALSFCTFVARMLFPLACFRFEWNVSIYAQHKMNVCTVHTRRIFDLMSRVSIVGIYTVERHNLHMHAQCRMHWNGVSANKNAIALAIAIAICSENKTKTFNFRSIRFITAHTSDQSPRYNWSRTPERMANRNECHLRTAEPKTKCFVIIN